MARDLNSRSNEVLGVDQKIWLILETGGFGGDAVGGLVPLAAGAVEHITGNITFDIPREDSASRSGRSKTYRLSGKKEVAFSWESYIIPGTPDGIGNPTLPPVHPLLLSAFGEVDVTDPTKIVYSLSRFNENSFRMLEEATHYARLGLGMVCESMTFNLPGDGKAQISAEGFGQDVYVAGESALAQAVTGSDVEAELILQDITYTAVAVDSSGNLVNITYTDGATAGAEVVTVSGNDIGVQIEDGVSTATEVKAAYDLIPAAVALATSAISGTAGDPQDVVTATFLTGGLGDDEMLVTATQGQRFEVGAYIDTIDASDGNTATNSALLILAVGTGVNADVIQVDSVLSAAIIGDFVIGHAPDTYSPIQAEFALLGLKGTLTIAGFSVSACEVISAEISLTNNYTKKDFIYGTSRICGYIPDKRREVGVKLELLLNKDNFTFFMRNKQFIAEDITLTLEPQDIPAPSFDSSTGRTWKFEMPRVEFNIPPIEQPSDSYVTLSLEGVALAVDMDNLDTELTLTIE